MFNLLSYKGNTNQNYTKIPYHFSQNGYHQENKQQMLARMQKKGTFTHYWWEYKLVEI
jgi:hypothetical protein